MDNAHWLRLLQDDDKKMSHDEITQYQEPNGRPKKNDKTIAHCAYFYQVVYSLAGDVLALLETMREEYFTCHPVSQKNMSNTIVLAYIGLT